MPRILTELLTDARELARNARGNDTGRTMLEVALSADSYRVTALQRLREQALRTHVPGVNHALRIVQTAVFGIELGRDVTIGNGVYFVHPIGIVIGGDTRIGNRVRFMGNNTVGTAKDNGYPTIEDDVVIGAGARILGPITVGARSVIGANAVVVTDIPPDSVAVGIPARVQSSRKVKVAT
jgi:serine O-acetyltransferase